MKDMQTFLKINMKWVWYNMFQSGEGSIYYALWYFLYFWSDLGWNVQTAQASFLTNTDKYWM